MPSLSISGIGPNTPVPSTFAHTYSPGRTTALPLRDARIFSAIVMPMMSPRRVGSSGVIDDKQPDDRGPYSVRYLSKTLTNCHSASVSLDDAFIAERRRRRGA